MLLGGRRDRQGALAPPTLTWGSGTLWAPPRGLSSRWTGFPRGGGCGAGKCCIPRCPRSPEGKGRVNPTSFTCQSWAQPGPGSREGSPTENTGRDPKPALLGPGRAWFLGAHLLLVKFPVELSTRCPASSDLFHRKPNGFGGCLRQEEHRQVPLEQFAASHQLFRRSPGAQVVAWPTQPLNLQGRAPAFY